jgi:hypothetical protein
MAPQAFIAYSIPDSDAHMVYELGKLMEQQGYTAVYAYDHPEHPMGQHSFDEIAVSMMFVGLLTHPRQVKTVVQLWQYARSQGIPAMILCENTINLPVNIARDPNVITFRRFMPENPIKYIEIWMSRF